MSKWYKRIKEWYETGRWNKVMVGNAVAKKKITAEEYKTITGEAYEEE